jgi:DNA replication protein DnaC
MERACREISLLVILFFSITGKTFCHDDPYKGMDYHKVFNQSATINKFRDNKITPELFNEALVGDLEAKKGQIVYNKAKKELFVLLINLSVFGAFLMTNYKFSPGTFWDGRVTQLLLSQVVSIGAGFLKEFFSSIWDIFHPQSDPLYKWEKLYAEKKRYIPQRLQKEVEKSLSLARKYNSVETCEKFLKCALYLPFQGKQPNEKAISILKNSLTGYTPDIFPQIEDAIKEHIRRFSKSKKPNSSPKPILYFQGPPGVGKTFIAEQISKALKLPAIKISLATENLEDIIGAFNKPGRLLESLTKKNGENVRNAVLILDEADRVFNNPNKQHFLNSLLPLMEPSTKYIESPYLEDNVDISHYLIIAIGNNPIMDSALASRFNIVYFDDMTPEYKANIAINKILPELAYSESPKHCIDLKKLNSSQWAEIRSIIAEQTDGNLRELQRKLATYLNTLRKF